MTQLLIKNGRIIDPANNVDTVGDLLVSDGKIAAVGKSSAKVKPDQTIDAADKLIVPGLIDMHVHLREPGDEEVETVASGTQAAVAGGFTAVACMPNTDPAIDNEASVEFISRQAARADMAHVFPIGAITKGRQGQELAEMGQMVRAGAVGFSDDGDGVANAAVLLQALKYSSMFDRPIMEHCEDKTMSGGCMNSGHYASILGLPGINPLAEELMLYRDVQLTKQAKARLHAQHISTAGSARIVRTAKAEGVRVTAEVTPHHLLLTDADCQTYNSNFKMNPPLRRQEDIDALRLAIADGTIDCLVTDHAPHLRSQKELEFRNAPFGIISLDVALGLYVKALIDTNTIDWPRLIQMMTIAPAQILQVPKGTLSVGADADITVIDPKTEFTVCVDKFASKSRNCPYDGWQLHARAAYTIVNGKIKHSLH
ncbi:MAG: dihydroorotase [Sedimentisphaerales bacterium]|nr:dihydroorotase [Sedimentisphaerales bacterium]